MGGGIKVNILNKEAKKFWTEKGLFWGAPSGLKKGPVGSQTQDEGPHSSHYEGPRGQDFWGLYFLRFRDSYRTLRIKDRTCRTSRTQDEGPHISPYEGPRGQDFWCIYFLRFRDSYRTLRIKERTFRTLRTQDQGPHVFTCEGPRGQDFWGIYFLRFRDSYRTLRN